MLLPFWKARPVFLSVDLATGLIARQFGSRRSKVLTLCLGGISMRMPAMMLMAMIASLAASPALSNIVEVRINLPDCLADAVDISDTRPESPEGGPVLAGVRNKLDTAISGIEYEYEVATEGRSIPWFTSRRRYQTIPGGVEPSEQRTDIRLSFVETIGEAWFQPLIVTVRIHDLLDAAGANMTATGIVCGTPITMRNLATTIAPCWGIGSGTAKVTIVVAFEVEDGRPVVGSLKLDDVRPAQSGAAVEAAFLSARRAILRCAAETGRWQIADQTVEMTFDFTSIGNR